LMPGRKHQSRANPERQNEADSRVLLTSARLDSNANK
jgi:hypothetical protein